MFSLIALFAGELIGFIFYCFFDLLFQLLINSLVEGLGWTSRRHPIPEAAKVPSRLVFADFAIWSAFILGSSFIFLPSIREATQTEHHPDRVTFFLALIFCGAMGWLAASVRHRAADRMGRKTWRRPNRNLPN